MHPNIHGGILARRDQKHHIEALSTHGIGKLFTSALCYQFIVFDLKFCFHQLASLFCSFSKKIPFSGTFDVVVVNLYPFYDKVTSTGGVEFEDGIENIDIGGPAMIRAAAKVVCLTENANFFKSPPQKTFILSLKKCKMAQRMLCWPNTTKLLWKIIEGSVFIAYFELRFSVLLIEISEHKVINSYMSRIIRMFW